MRNDNQNGLFVCPCFRPPSYVHFVEKRKKTKKTNKLLINDVSIVGKRLCGIVVSHRRE